MNPMTTQLEEKRYAQPAKPEPPEAEPSVARGEASGGSGLETPPQRWGVKRKAEIVLRLLRGEALDTPSRQCQGLRSGAHKRSPVWSKR